MWRLLKSCLMFISTESCRRCLSCIALGGVDLTVKTVDSAQLQCRVLVGSGVVS